MKLGSTGSVKENENIMKKEIDNLKKNEEIYIVMR